MEYFDSKAPEWNALQTAILLSIANKGFIESGGGVPPGLRRRAAPPFAVHAPLTIAMRK
jgi:hypothetical protein